jgi:Mlc titration factor MtfA (ptsG expression regulator)
MTVPVCAMLFPLFRSRRSVLLSKPFPDEWLGFLERNVALYAILSESEQAQLHDLLRLFIAEKSWEGCRGLAMTDEIKVTVAGQACLLLLGLPRAGLFKNVQTILVYPTAFVSRGERRGPDGVVDPRPETRLGEAWANDWPVILSWENALREGRDPGAGHSVVLHEFAHKLDTKDGAFDGVPDLPDRRQYDRWSRVMSSEYSRLVSDYHNGRPTLLDTYGTTDAAEFFAVCTECFFTRSHEMRAEHPALYDLLKSYYGQDTAGREQIWPTEDSVLNCDSSD